MTTSGEFHICFSFEVMEKSGKSFLQQDMVAKIKESALVQARSTEVAMLLSKAEGKQEVTVERSAKTSPVWQCRFGICLATPTDLSVSE